jgi:hypothetical protein
MICSNNGDRNASISNQPLGTRHPDIAVSLGRDRPDRLRDGVQMNRTAEDFDHAHDLRKHEPRFTDPGYHQILLRRWQELRKLPPEKRMEALVREFFTPIAGRAL